jgi:hypothetical protein
MIYDTKQVGPIEKTCQVHIILHTFRNGTVLGILTELGKAIVPFNQFRFEFGMYCLSFRSIVLHAPSSVQSLAVACDKYFLACSRVNFRSVRQAQSEDLNKLLTCSIAS